MKTYLHKSVRALHRVGVLALLAVALMLPACVNPGEAEYITEPTEIKLTVNQSSITASTAQVRVEPVDDRAYFYVECKPVGHYVPGTMDRDFMMLVMDSVYISYLSWRHRLLTEGQTYVAPFSSHCLKYGVQDVHFTELTPSSRYIVYAFAVNPVSNQPMGDLYYAYFETDSVRKSSLTFQFSVDMDAFYVMPSNDNDYYVVMLESVKAIREDYHGSYDECVEKNVEFYAEYNILDLVLHKNAYRYAFEWLEIHDDTVALMAAGYDGRVNSDAAYTRLYFDRYGVPTWIDAPQTPMSNEE